VKILPEPFLSPWLNAVFYLVVLAAIAAGIILAWEVVKFLLGLIIIVAVLASGTTKPKS